MNTSLWYGGSSPHQPFHCSSPQSPPPTGPNMLRPITPAPTFSSVSSMIRVLWFTSPPGWSCESRHAASAMAHSCSRSPPSPSGFSSLWFGPATNPSAEIEMWHLSLLIVSVVVAAGAGADARQVGAVDVDRDRRRVGDVVHAVDVAGRREAADVAGVVVALADHVEVGVEQLLVLDALDDAEHAPGDVVVDASDLPGPPDQGDDRERSVRLDVQVVGGVVVG